MLGYWSLEFRNRPIVLKISEGVMSRCHGRSLGWLGACHLLSSTATTLLLLNPSCPPPPVSGLTAPVPRQGRTSSGSVPAVNGRGQLDADAAPGNGDSAPVNLD